MRVSERLAAAPGVQRVGATTSLPFDGAGLASQPDDRAPHRRESPFPVRVHPRLVSTGYFQTMGIPLVRGRGFTDHDAETSGQRRRSSTRRRRAATGRTRIRSVSGSASAPTDDWREIVGVVGDTRHEGLDADADPAAYLPQHQRFESLGTGFERAVTLVIRTSGDAASVAPLIRDRGRERRSAGADRPGSSDGRSDRRLDCAAAPQLRARLGVCRRRAGADRGGPVRRDGVSGRRSGRARSACGWRSARRGGRCSRWCCARPASMTLLGIGARRRRRAGADAIDDDDAVRRQRGESARLSLDVAAAGGGRAARGRRPSSRATRIDPLAALRES